MGIGKRATKSIIKHNRASLVHSSLTQVRDDYVLEASDDGRGEGRVVVRAEERAIVQNESKDAAEAELRDEVCVGPTLELHGCGDVARVICHE